MEFQQLSCKVLIHTEKVLDSASGSPSPAFEKVPRDKRPQDIFLETIIEKERRNNL